MSELRVSPRAGVVISGLVALGFIVLAASIALRSNPDVARRGVGSDRTEYGKTIPLTSGLALLDNCRCPGLPTAGEAAKAEVVRAWQQGDDFGFVFDSGMTLSYEATSETPDDFAKKIEGSLEDPDEAGPIGRLVTSRGTQVWVKDLDDHGPAFVEWVEGGKEITLVGGDNQDLSAVLAVAESLTSVAAG